VPDVDLQYADADAVISPIADEVMLSDKMISELGLVPEDVGKRALEIYVGAEGKRSGRASPKVLEMTTRPLSLLRALSSLNFLRSASEATLVALK